MKIIMQQFLRNLFEDEQTSESFPDEIVNFLVKMYARKGAPQLKYQEHEFSKIAKTKKLKLPGDINVDWNKVDAAYSYKHFTLIVNTESKSDVKKKISDILHEIQHYNQHTKWLTDGSFREKFVKGKKLPSSVVDDPISLYEISWNDITEFWVRKYGYANAPHEVDAKRFADLKVGEAYQFVIEHFSDVLPK
jgi:hypothetical protein